MQSTIGNGGTFKGDASAADLEVIRTPGSHGISCCIYDEAQAGSYMRHLHTSTPLQHRNPLQPGAIGVQAKQYL